MRDLKNVEVTTKVSVTTSHIVRQERIPPIILGSLASAIVAILLVHLTGKSFGFLGFLTLLLSILLVLVLATFWMENALTASRFEPAEEMKIVAQILIGFSLLVILLTFITSRPVALELMNSNAPTMDSIPLE